jgi:REP element-mobilizing transposase RayT
MSELPKRKRNRLKNYEYSQNGMYFVTICTKNHANFFGRILSTTVKMADGVSPAPAVEFTDFGKIAEIELKEIPKRYIGILVDCFVIMPNHVHAIIINVSEAGGASPAPTLSVIIGGYKSGVSRLCGYPLWQRSFHDHIIRNERAYCRISQYIENNPSTWEADCFFKI